MTELRIELLGGFRVVVEGGVVDYAAWRRKKPAAVVRTRALEPRRRPRRAQVTDADAHVWQAVPDFRERIGRVLQHVDTVEPSELGVVAEVGAAVTSPA